MSAITFEPVNDEYYWGYYAKFRVLIMKANGYINATKMCNSANMKFKNWIRNQSSKALIERLEASAHNIADEKSIITITGGRNSEYRGTYVHRKLIVHIASWISPDYALKVSDIVLEYHLKEEKEKNAVVVHQKDSEISELKSMVARMEAKSDAALKDLSNEVSKLSLDNKIINEKLDAVVEDRVVRHDPSSNTIAIYESIDQGPNRFYIFRVQKRGFKAALNRYLNDNPNAVKFAEIEYNPNSINYFNRFKNEYNKEIRSHYNNFELLSITKDQLREFIDKINHEKYELENVMF